MCHFIKRIEILIAPLPLRKKLYVNCSMVLQSSNGLGLQAVGGENYCLITMRFPQDTIPKWVSSLDHFDGLFIYLLSRRIPIKLEH